MLAIAPGQCSAKSAVYKCTACRTNASACASKTLRMSATRKSHLLTCRTGAGSKDNASTAGGDSDPNSGTVGLLTSKASQSKAYSAFVAASLGFGVAALAAPGILVQVACGFTASELELVFTRIAGATMLISVAVEYSLKVRGWLGCMRSVSR